MSAKRDLSEDEILQMLLADDSNECDLSDGNDVVEIDVVQDPIRIGIDKLPLSKENRYAEEIQNAEEEEEEIDLLLKQTDEMENTSQFNDAKFTEKSKIKWKRKTYENAEIDYSRNTTPPVEKTPELPIVYFEKYISKEFCEKIAMYTNMYAEQQGKIFKHTDAREIRNLFAMHILMGTLKYPRVDMYWNSLLHVDCIRELMPKNRFYSIRQNLHLINNLDIPADNKDKLIKIRPIYEELRKRCAELRLEKNLCVDEQIIPFKGRLNIKQYIKGKPCPWGLKVFVLCGTSGIFYDFIMYQGSTTEIEETMIKKYGLGASVVIHLIQNRLQSDQKYFLAFDNYFTTYQLLEYLKAKNISGLGTARINRFACPPFSQKYKKIRGYTEEVVSMDDHVVLTKWYDNKEVIMASNFCGIGQKDSVQRWDKSSMKYINVDRPQVVKIYNQTMGGVDKLDQLISFYRIHLQSKKWTLRVIMHAVDMAIANCWQEYKIDCDSSNVKKKDVMDLLQFRLRLADNIINFNSNSSTRKRGRPLTEMENVETPKRRNAIEYRPYPETLKDGFNHFPSFDEKKEATRCKLPGCTKKTHVFCTKCKVHLCFVVKQRNCFTKYHQ